MDLQIAISLAIGSITPVLVGITKQPRFKGTKWNLLIAVGTCLAVGAGTAYLNGQLFMTGPLTVETVFATMMTVTAGAFTAYEAYWKGSKVEEVNATKGLQ